MRRDHELAGTARRRRRRLLRLDAPDLVLQLRFQVVLMVMHMHFIVAIIKLQDHRAGIDGDQPWQCTCILAQKKLERRSMISSSGCGAEPKTSKTQPSNFIISFLIFSIYGLE